MLKEIFSQRLNTQSKTVNNAIITLGDIDDSGKGRKFKSRFLTPGIAGYPGQFGNVLIKKESFDKFIKTLEGAPVIINHKNLTEDNADTARVGVVSNVWFNDKDGWYWCDGIIWDKTAQNLITDKGWSVSCSYDVKLADDAGGSENNIPYNIEFLDGVFTHLAIVNNPRYERANIVFNSKTEVINDKWITIKPHGKDSDDYRRIKLEDGETPKEAIERIYKKEDTTEETQAKGETQDNPLDDRKERINKLVKLADDISMFDSGSIEQREHQRLLDEIKKLGLSKEETEKAIHNLWDYHENILKYKANAPSAYKVGLAEFNKRVGFEKSLGSYEKALQIEAERNSYIKSLKDKQAKEKKEQAKIDLGAAVKDASQKGLLKFTHDGKTYFRSRKNANFILLDQYTQKKYDKIFNNKEQDMALLDELKKLITKVENDKGEDMDDKEKVENEKVDKRDIIRQIMAIAGKHEDNEDVRTIAKLAEKLAYDKSEAGTADNENEDDLKSEKDTADNKKVKNESEEDNKKYEDLKKETKEDVENKCKNSVDNSKGGYFDKMNEIYNSANEPKEENLYISREQKLKDAETYFAK